MSPNNSLLIRVGFSLSALALAQQVYASRWDFPTMSLLRNSQHNQMQENSAASNSLTLEANRLSIGFSSAAVTIGGKLSSASVTTFAISGSLGYGINENWTLLDLTTAVFNLKGQNGHGHEWVLIGGLVRGFSYFEFVGGIRIQPNLGFAHTWTSESGFLRITTPLIYSVYYSTKPVIDGSHFHSNTLNLSPTTSFRVGEFWSLGVTLGPKLQFGPKFLAQSPFKIVWATSASHKITNNTHVDFFLGTGVDGAESFDSAVRANFSISHAW